MVLRALQNDPPGSHIPGGARGLPQLNCLRAPPASPFPCRAPAQPRRRSRSAWEEATLAQIRRDAEQERTNRGRGGRIEEAGDGGGGREDDGDEDEDGGARLPSRSGSGGPRGCFLLPQHPPLPRWAQAVGAALSLTDPTHIAPLHPTTPAPSADSSSNPGRRPPPSRPAAPPAAGPGSASAGEGPHAVTAPRCEGANRPRGMRERDAPATGDGSPFPSLSCCILL
jgi:hypothetical protein